MTRFPLEVGRRYVAYHANRGEAVTIMLTEGDARQGYRGDDQYIYEADGRAYTSPTTVAAIILQPKERGYD